MKKTRCLACFLVVVFGHVDSAFSDVCKPLNFDGSGGSTPVPISSNRVLLLKAAQKDVATRILGAKSSALLSDVELREILGDAPLVDPHELLGAQVNDAMRSAKICESMEKNPELKYMAASLEKSRASYERFAAYTRGLPGILYPYLVRVPVYSLETGVFSASLLGDRLLVSHISLGDGAVRATDALVVVLSEARVMSTAAGADYAR